MYPHCAPIKVIALVLGGVQLLLGAVPDSVYTHLIDAPDFLSNVIVAPIPPSSSGGLKLIGWPSGLGNGAGSSSPLTPANDVSPMEDIPPKALILTAEQSRMVLRRGAGMLPVTTRAIERGSEIDSTGNLITFYEEHDGTPLRLPVTLPLAWYIPNMLASRLDQLVRSGLTVAQTSQTGVPVRRRATFELLGADIAGQRVSLSVSGNVVIKGDLRFKDQSKSATNFRANKNWEMQVDQTQRFNIEGTIGDRIRVRVDQDSENDFDWENDMSIVYTGPEDEILKRVEAGNISLSLPGTQFATGGSGKSNGLFGIKAVSQLGPVNFTTVASIERSRKSSKTNTLSSEFSISELNYLSNRYFFLDMEFRASYYPLSVDGRHVFNPNRVVGQLLVYRSSREGSDTYPGTAYVDPNDQDFLSSSKAEGHFERLLENRDYIYNYQLGTFRLNTPANANDIIAVAYTIGIQVGDSIIIDTNIEGWKVGNIDYVPSDSVDITLKLIKDKGQTASYPTWPLAFKNVYSLGGSNINPEGFEVQILDRGGSTDSDDRFTNGVSFLTIFGLDQQNINGEPLPDELIDVANSNIVNLSLGELHFPALLPFTFSRVRGLATNDSALFEIYGYELEDIDQDFVFDRMIDGVETDQTVTGGAKEADGDGQDEDFNDNGKFDVPAIYYKPNSTTEKRKESRFDIIVRQSSLGASVFNLGFNMVPGSETVSINGEPLVRDKDYKIDGFSGTLTILDMSKYPNPEVSIDYEENVFISFDKKVMLGTRAEIDLGENSFLGLTGLYYNQSIAEERIDVGSEPIQNMLWDINGRISRDVPFLTRLVDRLPLVKTDAASRFRIEGEIAQVRPNPNPLGTAYVDDFEAAKRVTSPSLQYRAWRQSSPPLGKSLSHRRKLAWWNPFNEWSVKDIWPQRETSVRARNNTTTILILDAFFQGRVNNVFDDTVTDSLWAGITFPLLPSEYDQTLSKFFEIWVRGNVGQLHIDVGTISEDINNNGRVDTEDRATSGFREGNGILDAGEDVGLDGCPDVNEDGTGGCFDVDDDGDGRIDEEIFDGLDNDGDGLIDEDLAQGQRPTNADPGDPNGDNWSNTQSNVRNDNINGTEGNSRSQEGSYPDTEDLNGNGASFVDDRNDYFTFKVQLDENHPDFDRSILGGATENNGVPTGWRLFRISLTEFERTGDATVSWDDVRNLRLWIDGLGDAQYNADITAHIQIAKIEFVGSEWEELGLAPIGSETYVRVDTAVSLAVTVANTEDNADYDSPPDVRGEFDRINAIRLREQSLVMDFSREGIPPGFKGAISKSTPDQAGTFLVYNSLSLFIHGEEDQGLMTEDSTSVVFWLRLGQGLENGEVYYEVRKPVYPGWDPRNHIEIDMPAIARLKKRDTPDMTIIVDADTLPGYYLDGMEVYIKGDPSLERIRRYTAGVINTHPEMTIRGRVMLDELRLSKVRRDPGMAVRLSGDLNFADLLATTFNYTRQDADYHTVQQRITPNALTSESWKANVRFNPERFMPQSWGVRTPLNMSYSSSIRTPKYLPGKDVLTEGLPGESLEEIQKRSVQVTFKGSFDKSARSKYWLMRQTLDRLRGSVTFSTKRESSELIFRNQSQSIVGQLSYPITFSDENYLHLFKVLEPIPWLGDRLKDTRLYYTPTNLEFSGNASEVISGRITRATPDTSVQTYNFNVKRTIRSQYRVTNNLTANYTWDVNSILDEDRFRYDKLKAVRELDPGLPIRRAEQFTINYNPNFITWFKPKLSYQSQYNWNKNQPINDPERGGRISVQGRISGNVNLAPKDIIEIFYTPEDRAGSRRGGSRRRSRGQPSGGQKESDGKKPFEVTNPTLKAILKRLHAVAGKFTPIAFNYGYNRQTGFPAVIGQPGYAYRVGLNTSPGLPTDTLIAGQSTFGETRDIAWRTGINLTKSLNLNVSHARKFSARQSTSTSTISRSEDFLVLGDSEKVGVPFFNWSVRWSNLERLPILNKVPWRVSLDHTYSGNHTSDQQNGQLVSDKYTRQFQPLIGLTLNFNNGISSTFRTSRSRALTRNDAGDSRNTSQRISANMTYRRRGGITLPLPFLRDFKLQNTVNFSLEFDLSNSVTDERKGEGTDFTTTRTTKSWSIKPYMTYTFSDKVTGSVRLGYKEDFNDITGKRIVRSFGFDVNIAIRGQ